METKLVNVKEKSQTEDCRGKTWEDFERGSAERADKN